MKSYKVVKSGEPLEEQQIDKPSPSGKEILIKTISCGVCHTDIHIHDGYFEPMDTYREYVRLNELWESGNPPWRNF